MRAYNRVVNKLVDAEYGPEYVYYLDSHDTPGWAWAKQHGVFPSWANHGYVLRGETWAG